MWCVAANACLMHPQDFVAPLARASLATVFSLPQEHLHTHFPGPCVDRRSTVNIPKTCPVMSAEKIWPLVPLMHPQLLRDPLAMALVSASMVFPHAHLHTHRESPDGWGASTVRWPKAYPTETSGLSVIVSPFSPSRQVQQVLHGVFCACPGSRRTGRGGCRTGGG